jgi:AcrR family transcriptional regulator
MIPRIDIRSIRREQVIEAATSIIAEQGLQNLSLSEIEKKTGMSRGQLTYYFRAKEDILLAVFDRLVQVIHQRVGTPEGQACEQAGGWEWVQHLLHKLVVQPPVSREFGCLQYAFLSQIGHREDFRRRLATLYGEWRAGMAQGLAEDLARRPAPVPIQPRALATVVQAILHGLAMQRAADPDAFQPEEIVDLCLDMLGSYLGVQAGARKKRAPVANKKMVSNGSPAAAPAPARRPQRGKS